ncbi:MAG: CHASE domain-containing protein [Acidimicrobiales bacterium]
MAPRPEPTVRPAVIAAAFLVLILFVLAATSSTVRANRRYVAVNNSIRTAETVDAIEARMMVYTQSLNGVSAAMAVDPDLDQLRFHQIVGHLAINDRIPEVQVIGVAQRVERAELNDYTAGVKRAPGGALGYPEFQVHPDTGAEELMIITMIEPQAGNEAAFGLDLLSEDSRADTAARARDTGEPALTAPLTLVQETEDQRAVVIMVPLYEANAAASTLGQRRAAFLGVVYAAVRIDDLVGRVAADTGIPVEQLVDLRTGDSLYRGGEGSTEPLPPTNVGQLNVGGRLWSVTVATDPYVLSWAQRLLPVLTMVGGAFIGVLFVGLIVSMATARSRAHALAIEMTDELEALAQATNEAIVTLDLSNRIVGWNQGAAHLFGGESGERTGAPAAEIFAAADWPGLTSELAAMARAGSRRTPGLILELTAVNQKGDHIPVEVASSIWSARGGRFITLFVRDVTDRHEAERRIRETTETLVAVLRATTTIAVIATDPDGRVGVFNAGAEQMLGYDGHEVTRDRPDLTRFYDAAELAARADQLGLEPGFEVLVDGVAETETTTRRWTYIRADGSTLPVEVAMAAMRGEGDTMMGYVTVATDVTERMATAAAQEDALAREREMVVKLTELDQVKNDFVSAISHDLRTPLTSIVGYAEILGDVIADGHGRPMSEHVEMIERNAQRLLSLVEDLLTLSRIESGGFRLQRGPCRIDEIVGSAVDAVTPIAEARGIEVVLDLDPVPLIAGDARELERAVLNLLSNAVKFSHDGGAVEVATRNGADGLIEITVTDHGLGIPEDEQHQLFSRFFRSRLAEQNAIQGTGLGLAIVAGIVQGHGGMVGVASVPGEVTTMTIRIPLDTGGPGRLDGDGDDREVPAELSPIPSSSGEAGGRRSTDRPRPRLAGCSAPASVGASTSNGEGP